MKIIESLPEYSSVLSEYGITLSECTCFLFEAGESIIEQGKKGEFLYFIVDGIAQVQVCSPEGNILSLGYSVSEGVLGEVELIRETDTPSAVVIAETRLICLAYPYWRAQIKCKKDARFMYQIAKDLAEKLSRSTGNYLSASFASAENRMCAYLLRESKDTVYRGTLARAAVATGISYRHLQRVMINLCQDGIIQKSHDGYHILDFDRLEKKAYA